MKRFAPYARNAVPEFGFSRLWGKGNLDVGLASREASRKKPVYAWLASLWFDGEHQSSRRVWEVRRYERQEYAYYEVMGIEATRRQFALADAHPEWEDEIGIEVEAPPPEPHSTRQPKMARAFKLLRDELREGERPAIEILAAAKDAWVSKRTLKEAKRRLVVEDTRHSFGGPVFWKPPRRVEVRWIPRAAFLKLAKYERSKSRPERRRASAES